MTRALIVHKAGPGITVQDLGRPGYLALGLSQGGAMDRLALAEGAALLGQPPSLAALEMVGMGGVFEATEDLRIALTGAPMRALIDGMRLAWNASHPLTKGARLEIGAAEAGAHGYLHVGGGIDMPCFLHARSAHLAAGIGKLLTAGDVLPIGPDKGQRTGLTVDPALRLGGGALRIVAGQQTALFSEAERARFVETRFARDARGNRMGMRLVPDGQGFATEGGLSILSEIVVPGDVQITGDGSPFILMAECQTTGGYPRIGTVLPCDLPRVAQTRPGEPLWFRFVTLEEASLAEAQAATHRDALARGLRPLLRDPRDMADLLSYQLVSGATAGDELEENQ